MTRGCSRLEYYFDGIQEAGVGLFNTAKGDDLEGRSSTYPSPAPSRIRARSNEMSGIASESRMSHDADGLESRLEAE